MIPDSRLVPCPLCGENDYHVRYPATFKSTSLRPDPFSCTNHGLSEHDDIVQCNHCGLLYNNPQLTPEELIRLYQNVEDPLYLSETEARKKTFSRSLRQLQKISPAGAPGRLLDIGCYTGVFLQEAAAQGWDVTGIELSLWAAQIARQSGLFPIYTQPLEQLNLPTESFSLVTLWDVIEHLSAPTLMLREIHRILKQTGIIAFSTHLVDSWPVRLLGTHYPFFMEMHLCHFSRKTVQQLLTRSGFELLIIKPHRRILRLGYFLEKSIHHPKLKPFRPLFRLARHSPWLSNRFIFLTGLGLFNIFAQKKGKQ